MKLLFRILERLSLDAVLVAVIWGFALGGAGPEMVILAMATWLTYVADRLWEVRPGKVVPETDRHLYYRNHYTIFRNIWLAGFPSSILLAMLFLPGWKVAWGWALVGSIVLYLWAISRMQAGSKRVLLKRIVVPLVFTVGVVWMVEGWRTWEGLVGSAVLLSAAFSNVLLISYWENHDKNRPDWLERFTTGSLLLLLISSHMALFFYWPLGVAGLLCAGGYFFLLVYVKTGKADYLRTWVDGILVVSGLVVVLITYQ